VGEQIEAKAGTRPGKGRAQGNFFPWGGRLVMRGILESMPKPLARSFVKGLLAGVVGGLVGAAAKVAAEKMFPPRTEGQVAPPLKMVERAEEATGANLSPEAKEAAAGSMHWVFGAVAGGIYGVAAEYRPGATAWHGAAFGLSVNKLMHEGVLPRTGFVAPVEEQPFQERMSEWLTHAVYGLATETARRVLRKRL
jgi:putative membrane protein